MQLELDTKVIVLAAGLLLLWALGLGALKYRQMSTSADGTAHRYVDIAHRAALMYSFAALVLAVLAHFSAWSVPVDLTAASVVLLFFVGAIVGYTVHGVRRDTENQFVQPVPGTHVFMYALIVGEIGGTAVLIVGFVVEQFFGPN